MRKTLKDKTFRGCYFKQQQLSGAVVLEGLFWSVLLSLGDIRILTKSPGKQGGGAK